MRASLLAVLLAALPASAQVRIEASVPRLAAVPAVMPVSSVMAAPSLSPVLMAPAPSLLSAPSVMAAPALSAPLAAATPAAAADGPVAPDPKKDLASAARAAAPSDDAALPARSLNAFWDGLGVPAEDEPLFASPSAVLPEAAGSAKASAESAAPWLALSDRKHAAALEAAIRLARGTRAGRRAFAAAEKALGDGTLPVDVLDLGRNYGEFDYLANRLRLDRKLFKPGREADLAGTLAHELMHVAQHAQGLPSNALELEIEAHLLDLELLAELGVKPPKNTFARQAYDALREGPKQFAALIELAVPGSPFLGGNSYDDVLDQLEQDLENMQARRGKEAAKLADVIASDIVMLRTPAGRRAYENFSRRVMQLLKRSSAAAR